MTERELLKKAFQKDMPDLEQIRQNCLAAPVPHKKSCMRTLVPIALGSAALLAAVFALPKSIPPEYQADSPAASSYTAPSPSAYDKARLAEPRSDILIINNIEELPGDGTAMLSLGNGSFSKLSTEELSSYYGVPLLSSYVPEDFTLIDENRGITRDENGNILNDANCFSYVNGDARIVAVLSSSDYEPSLSTVPGLDASSVSSIPLWLAVCGSNFHAQFTLNGIYFDISGINVSQDEFTNMITGYISRKGV